jgi:hypothetical protein
MWKTIASVFCGIAGGLVAVYATIFLISRAASTVALRDVTLQYYFSFGAALLFGVSLVFGPWLAERLYRGKSKSKSAPKAVTFVAWLGLAALTLYVVVRFFLFRHVH